MSNCIKCGEELPVGAAFCPACGKKQAAEKQRTRRGNGQGCVYKRGRTYTAIITTGYVLDAAGKKRRRTVSRSGFRTAKDAWAYVPQLSAAPKTAKLLTMREIYDKWLPTHRAGESTIGNYKAAWAYFRPLWLEKLADLTVDDFQECLDDCPRGRRTVENMKALAGLIYKYAIPRRQADINMAQYLIVSGEHGSKDGLPMPVLEALKNGVREIPYADYIVSQCYLGFRPSELLALDAKDYDPEKRAFVGGSKTDAGRDRVVTVSPKIQPIIDALTAGKTSGRVFCAADGGPMSIKAYRQAFYAALDAVGCDNPTHTVNDCEYHKYTPHSCRHTFATLLKSVAGADKDKLELIGHTSTEMLRHYQDVNLDDLRRITDAL